ncbi:hypothetical protein OVS_03225 [Mycoplasma ovis str. Michigan]|uniref:Uncharacterized protein n=1 Tax=Mycoplasma ovis str. Michigan TaxID=1415773 RepID=A0ABM5P1S6_9MOLU|nr:hypothetical protein OVS_03225 [Mycoplasma ovis str. Michigan]
MSYVTSSLKILGCLSILCWITGSPFIFVSRQVIPKEKKRKSVTLGKTLSVENQLKLSGISNVEQLLKGSKKN